MITRAVRPRMRGRSSFTTVRSASDLCARPHRCVSFADSPGRPSFYAVATSVLVIRTRAHETASSVSVPPRNRSTIAGNDVTNLATGTYSSDNMSLNWRPKSADHAGHQPVAETMTCTIGILGAVDTLIALIKRAVRRLAIDQSRMPRPSICVAPSTGRNVGRSMYGEHAPHTFHRCPLRDSLRSDGVAFCATSTVFSLGCCP